MNADDLRFPLPVPTSAEIRSMTESDIDRTCTIAVGVVRDHHVTLQERAQALAVLGALRMEKGLILQRAWDGIGPVQSAAVRALGRFDVDDDVVNVLDEVLGSSNGYVREAALRTIATLSLSTFRVQAIEACSDDNPHVQAAALAAVGVIGQTSDLDVQDVVVAGLTDAYWKVSQSACRAARKLAHPGFASELHELAAAVVDGRRHQNEFRAIAGAIETCGGINGTADVLRAAMGIEGLRRAAVGASRSVGPSRELDHEVRRLLGDKDDKLRVEVVRTLHSRGVLDERDALRGWMTSAARPAIRRWLRDEPSRFTEEWEGLVRSELTGGVADNRLGAALALLDLAGDPVPLARLRDASVGGTAEACRSALADAGFDKEHAAPPENGVVTVIPIRAGAGEPVADLEEFANRARGLMEDADVIAVLAMTEDGEVLRAWPARPQVVGATP